MDGSETFDVLIGSIMLEPFKTTGHDLNLELKSHIFNAGVGGDTIPNVLYPMNLCLLQAAKRKEKVKIVIVNIDSDGSKPDRSLSVVQI